MTKFAGQKIDAVPTHGTGEVRITVYLSPPPPPPPLGHGVKDKKHDSTDAHDGRVVTHRCVSSLVSGDDMSQTEKLQDRGA